MGGHNGGASPVISRVRLVPVYLGNGALPRRPLCEQGGRVACIQINEHIYRAAAVRNTEKHHISCAAPAGLSHGIDEPPRLFI